MTVSRLKSEKYNGIYIKDLKNGENLYYILYKDEINIIYNKEIYYGF